MNKSSNKLFHPAFIIALAVLLVNDHFLKAAHPGWLTGKLSDFSGLFVLAVFVSVNAGRYFKSSKSIIIIHITIAFGFILWKIAPVENLFIAINGHIDIPLPSRVKDITDLIALAVLPLSYTFVKRSHDSRLVRRLSYGLQKAASVILILITGAAVIATPPGKKYNLEPGATAETYKSQNRLREIFEQTLAEQDIEIQNITDLDDTTAHYKLKFFQSDDPPTHDYPESDRMFITFLTLVYSPGNHTIAITNIDGWVTHDLPEEKEMAEFYTKYLIDPFLEKMK